MKMLNQSLKELRLIAENRNMNGYQSMPKDKLLRIITKGDRKSLFLIKKKEIKKSFYQPTRNNFFKWKREKTKKNLKNPAKHNSFKSKIKEIKEILRELIIDRNEIDDIIIKDIRNLLKSKRKDNATKDKVLRDIRALFESDDDHYYKPIKTNNAFSSSYIENKSNGDKHKCLSIKEYFNKIRLYLSDMINDFKTQGE